MYLILYAAGSSQPWAREMASLREASPPSQQKLQSKRLSANTETPESERVVPSYNRALVKTRVCGKFTTDLTTEHSFLNDNVMNTCHVNRKVSTRKPILNTKFIKAQPLRRKCSPGSIARAKKKQATLEH